MIDLVKDVPFFIISETAKALTNILCIEQKVDTRSTRFVKHYTSWKYKAGSVCTRIYTTITYWTTKAEEKT